jgi:hypothetical protein
VNKNQIWNLFDHPRHFLNHFFLFAITCSSVFLLHKGQGFVSRVFSYSAHRRVGPSVAIGKAKENIRQKSPKCSKWISL